MIASYCDTVIKRVGDKDGADARAYFYGKPGQWRRIEGKSDAKIKLTVGPGAHVTSLLRMSGCGSTCLESSSYHEWQQGTRGRSTRSNHLDVVLRPEPHIRGVFRSNPRDDDGNKEDEHH